MTTGGSLLKGSIFRTLDLLTLVGASFVLTPYLVHSLGDRVYGFWIIVGSLMGYYGVLEFGLSNAVARYMSQALGRGDVEDAGRVASTALVIFGALGLLAAAATGVAVALCPRFVHDVGDVALIRELLVIMGFATAAMLVSKAFLGMLSAGIHYDLVAFVSIARTILCNGAIYLCLRARLGIIPVAVTTLAACVLHCAALYGACRWRFPHVRLSLAAAAREKVGLLASYCSKSVACHLGDLFRFRMDTVVIATFLSASLVTPYSIGVRLVEGFAQLVLNSVGMMLPVFSHYEGQGNYDAMRESLLKVTKLGTILTVFVGASLIFYGRAFIERWMGPGFEASYVVAVILAVGYMLDLPQSPGVQLLYGLSRQEVYAVLNCSEGAVNLVLSLLFMRRWGIYGVALGSAVEFAFFKLLIQPFYVCRVIDLPVRRYLVDSILVTTAKTTAPLALYFYLVRGLVAASYASLIVCVGVQTLLFVPTAYFLIMGPAERRAVAAALRSLGLFGGAGAAAAARG